MLQSTPGMPDEDIEAMAKENIKERKEQNEYSDFISQASDEVLLESDNFLFWQFRTPFWFYSTEFTWKNENDSKRKEGESINEYVLRSLPEELHAQWNTYCSD